MRTRHGVLTLVLVLLLGAGGCMANGPAPSAPAAPELEGPRALDARAQGAPEASPSVLIVPEDRNTVPLPSPVPLIRPAVLLFMALPQRLRDRLIEEAGGLDRILAFLDNFGQVLPLQRNSPVGGGGQDIFAYMAKDATILSFPGLNTPADELIGYPHTFNRYIVYYTNAPGNFDIYRYDFETQTIDPFPTLNTPADEIFPTANLTGRRMAYMELTPDGPRLRLYDDRTHNAYLPAVEEFARRDCFFPRISLLGDQVAFASPVGPQLDLFMYDIDQAMDVTPPFVNSPANETQPSMSLDGRRLLFISNRRGNDDIYLADMTRGSVEPLVLANSDAAELFPLFLNDDEILFYSLRAGFLGTYTYSLSQHTVNTYPAQAWLPKAPRGALPLPPLGNWPLPQDTPTLGR